MQLDAWTFAFQCVNFLVLVGLLWRFLYRPVRDGIARRQAAITRALDEAAAATAAVASLTAERQAATAALDAEVIARRQALAAEAEAERARSQAEIRCAGESLLAETRARLQAERREAEADLRRAGAELALGLARRLLADFDARTISGAFLARLEAAVVALDAARLHALREDLGREAAVFIATAHALDESEKQTWTARLAAALGAELRPVFVTEPALIAGVELRLPGHVLACHWSGQLAHLHQEIRDEHPR
jgi:F-type H+-transporting ATPase subunit b